MNKALTIMIPVTVTFTGDKETIDSNIADIVKSLRTCLDMELFRSGSFSAKMEESVSSHELCINDINVDGQVEHRFATIHC